MKSKAVKCSDQAHISVQNLCTIMSWITEYSKELKHSISFHLIDNKEIPETQHLGLTEPETGSLGTKQLSQSTRELLSLYKSLAPIYDEIANIKCAVDEHIET